MSEPVEEFDKERFSLEDLGYDESQELKDEEGEFCTDGKTEALSPYPDNQGRSVEQARPVRTDFLENGDSIIQENLPLVPPISAPHPSGLPAQPSLKALVDGLLLPGRATVKSNDICAAIMLHPELTTGSSTLSMYSKMSGGLRNYVAGTAHAWLYTPKRRLNNAHRSAPDFASNSFSLVFVYPEDSSASSDNCNDATQKSKSNLHFGGRTYALSNDRVLLQHGTHKALGLRARKFAITEPPAELTSSFSANTSAVVASTSPTEMHLSSSIPSSVAPLAVPSLSSSSLTFQAPGVSGDGLFEADVVRMQGELQGNNLRRKLGLLREAWKREVASASSSERVSAGVYVKDEPRADNDGFDPHDQKRSKLRVGIEGNCDKNESDAGHIRRGGDLETLVDQCLKISADFERAPWTADALLQFKFDCSVIGEKLKLMTLIPCETKHENSNEKVHIREETSKFVHDEKMIVENPEDVEDFIKGFGPWIDEVVKTKELVKARCVMQWAEAPNDTESLAKQVASMTLNLCGAQGLHGLPNGDVQGRLQPVPKQLRTTYEILEMNKTALQRDLASAKPLRKSNGCNNALNAMVGSSCGTTWGARKNRGIHQVDEKTFCRAKIEALFAAHSPNDLSSIDEIIARNEGNYDQIFERWVEAKEFSATAVAAAHIKAVQRSKRQLRPAKSN